ncbi:hypothetical protein DFH06DRAFT_1373549 [Mycena polygramma]|nr:hypothetical protein DFH06DRAFT_1373549 [Mycena polygramma]
MYSSIPKDRNLDVVTPREIMCADARSFLNNEARKPLSSKVYADKVLDRSPLMDASRAELLYSRDYAALAWPLFPVPHFCVSLRMPSAFAMSTQTSLLVFCFPGSQVRRGLNPQCSDPSRFDSSTTRVSTFPGTALLTGNCPFVLFNVFALTGLIVISHCTADEIRHKVQSSYGVPYGLAVYAFRAVPTISRQCNSRNDYNIPHPLFNSLIDIRIGIPRKQRSQYRRFSTKLNPTKPPIIDTRDKDRSFPVKFEREDNSSEMCAQHEGADTIGKDLQTPGDLREKPEFPNSQREDNVTTLSSLWAKELSKVSIRGGGKRVRGNYMMGRLFAFSYDTGARAEWWEKHKTYRETALPANSVEDGCPGHLEVNPRRGPSEQLRWTEPSPRGCYEMGNGVTGRMARGMEGND